MKRIEVLFCLFILVFSSCINRDEKIVKYVDNDALYFDYQVWGDDERPIITVMLQFRTGNAEGSAVALQQPANVKLDNKELRADSTKLSGVYYEYETTIDSFVGKHSIALTGNSGKTYTEKFDFHPFRIASAWRDTLHRNDFSIQFDGLEKEDYIRVIALDTSFHSNGINDVDTVKEGKLTLTRQQLKNLVNGSVRIEFYREVEKPVKNGTTAGGYLLITYAVKRNFILAD